MNNKIYELSEDEFISLIRNKVWLGSYWKVIGKLLESYNSRKLQRVLICQ